MALFESRPFRPFKSSEEYLEAMKEDLAEWLNILYPELVITANNFMDRLGTGVVLCKHANNVRKAAEDYVARRQARHKLMTRSITSGAAGQVIAMGDIHYLPGAKTGTFFARDNVSNFITWCRKSLKIIDCLLFETDDLIMKKNEKHVILCLLEVSRRGAKFGMLAPLLIQMERQIDREIAADNQSNDTACNAQIGSNVTQINKGIIAKDTYTTTAVFNDSDSENDGEGSTLMYGPKPQIITNDLKSLDEMVRDLVEKCTCPSQFPMIRVSEGKYRIGDTKVLIFVRILRSHVMVRVGGGWDTLSHYLDKHDPCRCKAHHRIPISARFIPRLNTQIEGIELHRAQVVFDRPPPLHRKITSNVQLPGNYNNSSNQLVPHSAYGSLNKTANTTHLTPLNQKFLHRNLHINNMVEVSLEGEINKKSTFSPKLNRRYNSHHARCSKTKYKQEFSNDGPKSLPNAVEYQHYPQSMKMQSNSFSLANFSFDSISNKQFDNIRNENCNSLDKLRIQKGEPQIQLLNTDTEYKNSCKTAQPTDPVKYNLNDERPPPNKKN